ncbi:MAG: guanylate kinase [Thermoguttaceae bacterium]|nr:guanylate kinase [Thermoguttaceae bacterium]
MTLPLSTGQSGGKLIIVSGPSGVGKGTLLRRVRQTGLFPLVMSVSATTRAKRPGEEDGVDYYFLTREDFLARRSRGEFLESFEVYPGGALYGTLTEPVARRLEEGKWVILEIDVKGARQVLQTFPDAVSIFVLPPSFEDLEKRLRGRGTESEESLAKRLAQAKSELASADEYKYRVVNDRLDDAVADLTAILKNC